MFSQELFDQFLEQAIDILRLSAGERKKAMLVLQELEKELVVKLQNDELSKMQKRQVSKLLGETRELIDSYYKQIASIIEVEELSRYVAKETSYAFEISLGLQALTLPRDSYFTSLSKDLIIRGSPQSEWWAGQSADTAFKFAGQVRQGLMAAETNQQIISRIVGKNGQAGIMDVARKNAASLVQTSVQAVANDARRETFKYNSDVIKGIRQVSTLDSRTSLVCVSYSEAEWDLQFKPIGKTTLPFNGGCPRHFNCRSVEVPITKTFKELGVNLPEPKGTTRASSDGLVSVDTTFNSYLTRKGQSYQDEVLGIGRAKLWREGKITLRDLLNSSGRLLTLKELIELANKRSQA